MEDFLFFSCDDLIFETGLSPQLQITGVSLDGSDFVFESSGSSNIEKSYITIS